MKRIPTATPGIVELMTEHFGSLEDPRIDRTKHHQLIHILIMALCAAVCGADGWEAFEAFGKARRGWFATFLDLPHGVPCADTFRRVFCALNPRAFEACFRSWVQAFSAKLAGEVIAVDGKALRGAVDWATSKTPLHLLHVWATEQRLLLAQKAVAGAPGEVKVIPELLALLDLRGAIVTTDANGCTADVTRAVRQGGGHYVLALKGNRGALHQFVVDAFKNAPVKAFPPARVFRSEDDGHGRKDIREARVLELKDWPLRPNSKWTDLRTAMLIDRTRIVKGKKETERHYYITDLPPKADRIATAARAHWGVENHLHWSLDVGFDEDRRRIRDQNGAENVAVVTRLALMLLRSEKTAKFGLPTRRKNAAWDHEYLLRVLASKIGGN